MRHLIFGLILALLCDYILLFIINTAHMVLARSKGEIYGDETNGALACPNVHAGDLFYCPAAHFFIDIPLLQLVMFSALSLGAFVLVPWAVFCWLLNRKTKS